MAAGERTFILNGKNLSAGMYVVTLYREKFYFKEGAVELMK